MAYIIILCIILILGFLAWQSTSKRLCNKNGTSSRLAVGAVKAFQEFLAGRDQRINARKSARVTTCTCAGGLCRRILPELSQPPLPADCSYHVWEKAINT